MSTLHVNFPDQRPDLATSGPSRTHHVLCGPVDMQSTIRIAIEAHLTASPDALIHDNDHAVVYRAHLDDGLGVVLKFAVDEESVEDLNREAKAYESVLAPLQGSVIPIFHGKYQSTCPHGKSVSCIVLQDCGQAIRTELYYLPDNERYRILEQSGKFHMDSKHHPNDFAARNVVVSEDGQYRLIDFHRLTKHDCKFDGTWNFGQKSRRDFGCLTLEIIAMGLRAWDRGVPEGKVKVYGFEYPITWYPSQKVVDTLITEDECLQKLWNKSAALRWLRKVRVYVDQEDLDPDDEEKDFMATLEYAGSSKPQLSNTL